MGKKTKQEIYRQGDIMLKRVGRTPKLTPVDNGNVIAFGEATGHKHWFDTPEPAYFKGNDGEEYVVLIEDTALIHSGPDNKPVWLKEEAKEKDLHVALNIPTGKYIVRREKDYDPFTELTPQVAD